MNYADTIAFLYSRLPMFSRIGTAAYKKDLTNTLLLCETLDHPERKFKSIHIAGTNGKGSTSHMLAAILQQCGYKTGLYTSPHLKDFRERIRINGVMIPEKEVVEFVERTKERVLQIGCSFFEWTVGLAFDWFAKNKVDIAVIETGLGGRLDSTNVITPVLSVITNVSYDHMDLLGDTLEKIATEKAGIIKSNVPVVIGESEPADTLQVFSETAAKKKSAILFADQKLQILQTKMENGKLKIMVAENDGHASGYALDLMGIYQEKNLLTVLESVSVLRQVGFDIAEPNVFEALSHVKELTGLQGRWDILSEHPLIIADVAHNEAGIRHVMQQLKTYSCDQMHFVLGFVKEKDLPPILQNFPKDGRYYFCKPDIPRGLDETLLTAIARENRIMGSHYASVEAAFEAAKSNSSVNDLIYVGGSTFVVAEVI